MTTMMLPGGVKTTFRTRIRNVSRTGVAFLSCVAMPPNTRLQVQLPLGPNLSTVEREAEVRRCRPIEGEIYEVGAKLDSPVY